jgi:sulfotransferase
VRFEDFSKDPETEMKRVYEYLEIPYFSHDFNNVQQLTHENDVIHGIFGDHKIHPKVSPIPSDFINILGKDECSRIKSHYDWYFKRFNYF